ncbi:MAG: insulinase family protein [Prevotellaceae bacterium]|jgi:predicted Zn-dependent peptidase|nr:insulinase family protein [Prevotellaceae bacterium]
MIEYKKFILKNGLTLLVHRDSSSPIAVVNMLYKVGARDENPEKTGFAHLFEHLMFSGSKNVKSFDGELQIAGGENNAFTCNDYTNYYITLPKENIETALWIESDRMLYPNITQQNIDTQRNVVIEEFNQRYLNQPYGDVWLLLRPLAYKVHPYRWATIGKSIEHIKNAKLDDVEHFFDLHYSPNNAIISIVADIEHEKIYELVEKWFGEIPYRTNVRRRLPAEPQQTELRTLTVERNVPLTCLYKAYKICNRQNPDYYVYDLLTDILSSGKSSRLYQNLIKNTKLFAGVNAFISGDIDEGLLIVSARLLPDVDIKQAEAAINNEIEKMRTTKAFEYELEKVKNKVEASQIYSETSILNKAMMLGYYEMLGNIDLINDELKYYRAITAADIMRVSENVFANERCSTLYYKSTQQNSFTMQINE